MLCREMEINDVVVLTVLSVLEIIGSGGIRDQNIVRYYWLLNDQWRESIIDPMVLAEHQWYNQKYW